MTIGGGATGSRAGRNELGVIDIAPRVVEKVVGQIAAESPDAGAPSSPLLGRAFSRVGLGSVPGSELQRHPKVTATIDAGRAYLDVSLSVRWPCPVAAVTEDVRRRVTQRVDDLLGLTVDELTVTVVDLITNVSTARVA